MTVRVESQLVIETGRYSVPDMNMNGNTHLVTVARAKNSEGREQRYLPASEAQVPTAQVDHIAKVATEVTDEQVAQLAKWGVQNHPSAPTGNDINPNDEWYIAGAQADVARRETDDAAKAGRLTWAHIMQEETAETMEAAIGVASNPGSAEHLALLRKELVQVAAVANSWIQSIDRNNA